MTTPQFKFLAGAKVRYKRNVGPGRHVIGTVVCHSVGDHEPGQNLVSFPGFEGHQGDEVPTWEPNPKRHDCWWCKDSELDGLHDMVTVDIDEHHHLDAHIPVEGGIHFSFWNGAVRSSIRLSDEAFHAAVELYAFLQQLRVEEEPKHE